MQKIGMHFQEKCEAVFRQGMPKIGTHFLERRDAFFHPGIPEMESWSVSVPPLKAETNHACAAV
ncbi:hypothetical protein C6558_15500 [Ensifer sp. NM-2]|nr:hypothetical protein C6558_15500 [Ensifer sp. NM-2]